MGAAAVLAQDSLTVEPGGQVTTEIRVRNTGDVVDQFSFDALGPAASWATFEPSTISLFPDADGVSHVRFAPPRHPSTRAGTVPFGVRILAQEDPAGSVVAEGELLVGRFDEISAELVPRTARGRRSGRHELTIQNRGNTALRARLIGGDPDRRVRIAFRPPEALARPGGATVAEVEVRPRRRFLRGPAITHAYTVRVDSPDHMPVEVPGAFLQEALIPRWVPRALLALAALAVVWFAFLRPTVQSAAKTAVEDQVNEASQLAASQAVAPALAAADERLANVEKAVGITPGAPLPGLTTSTTRPGVLALGDPFDTRLEPRGDNPATATYTVPEGQVLSITDVFFENHTGASGTMSLRRGDQVLLQVSLQTFRDLDYHFVAPLVFPPESELQVQSDCVTGGPTPPPPCAPAMSLVGFLGAAPPPPPE